MQKKHWSLILVLGMLLSLLPQAVLAQAPNYYTSVIVSDVTSGAPVVGGTFTTDVSLSIVNNASPMLGVMGVDLYLGFDPAIVNVDDADDNPANGIQVNIATGFFGGSVVVAKNRVEVPCTNAGAAPACVHLALSHTGTPITNRTGKIATIAWGGLAVGPTGLTVLPETVLADVDGAAVPINSTSVPAISIVPAGTITGRVERQGMTDFTGSIVTAYNSGGGVIATGPTDAAGNFSLPVPQGGIYLVQAFYHGYLKAQKSNVYVVGATVGIGTTRMLGGDVNGDNNVNILDVVGIIGVFGTPGTMSTDINDDGVVNIFDLTIAAGNFTKVGPTAW
ncbi:MAG: hypothetical protein MUF84_07415 [Anaerolineae bacterium]|jgi:hypothetical protein|nr:hypothetical protein [Anaerolineae bacterium]